MPRKAIELGEPPKKKYRLTQNETLSMEISFTDGEALPPGIIFTDVLQKKWRIGKPIGRGSFGRIYLASDNIDMEVTKLNARYVVKIEPHSNGPLFVEVHCLIRTAKASKVQTWRQQNKQKCLGMPVYIASGSFTEKDTGVRYRFLILPRYEVDLQKIIADRGSVLDLKNVLILAIQILDVLEFLHNQGYTHSDIKSSNLMLGFDGFKQTSMPQPLFHTDSKVCLSDKLKRQKPNKSRQSNYYDDEDFVLKYTSGYESSNEKSYGKNRNMKKKLRTIFTDSYSRTLHRHRALNLRQLSNYVNYEDINSSVCSDQSYQRLLDEYENKMAYSSDEGFHEENKLPRKNPKIKRLCADKDSDITFNEAILSQSKGQIYLLDYGLASKFLDSDGRHKDFGMDARKAHDGTLEYSSRDSHIGAHSRRSDLETLGYNLLDWLTGTLPWKTTEMLSEPDLVHALKKNYMEDVKSLLITCFKTETYPQFLEKYLEYIRNLDFKEKPDYDYCRSIFKNEFLRNGFGTERDISLRFSKPMPSLSRKKCYSKKLARKSNKNTPTDYVVRNGVRKPYERENIHSLENDLKLKLLKETLNSSSDGIRKPCTSRNFFVSDADLVARLKKSLMPQDVLGKKLSPKNLRSNKRKVTCKRGRGPHRSSIGKFGNFMGSARQFTWAEILAGNPEHIIRKDRNAAADDQDSLKYRIRKTSNASDTSSDYNLQSPLMQKDYLQGVKLTYAMKEVLTNFRKKASGKVTKEPESIPEELQGYTPIMVKLLKIKEKREAKEILQELKEKQVLTKNITETAITRSRKPVKITKTWKKSPKKKASETVECENYAPSEELIIHISCNKKSKGRGKKKEAVSKKEIEPKAVECKNYAPTEEMIIDISCNKKSKGRGKKKEAVSKKEIVPKAVECENYAPTEELIIDISCNKKSKGKGRKKETISKKEVLESKAVKTKPAAKKPVRVPTNRRRLRSSMRNRTK